MTTGKTLSTAEIKMQKSVDALHKELGTIRTGRASPSLIEHVKVEYAGAILPLNQLATISAPAANSLMVQPWDKNSMNAIEKAILKSELGLTPINDGRGIRINIPALNEERRAELLKIVRRHIEEFKIGIRNVRRDALEDLKSQEKNKEISQDDFKHLQTQLQKITDVYILKIDLAGKDKEKEVMEV
jgi:ribosome recycling factor